MSRPSFNLVACVALQRVTTSSGHLSKSSAPGKQIPEGCGSVRLWSLGWGAVSQDMKSGAPGMRMALQGAEVRR